MIEPNLVKAHYNELSKPESFRAVAGTSSSLMSTRGDTIHTRPEFNPVDYYNQRPSQAIPTDINKIMAMSEDFYYKTGILRSIIDLISEFVTDGLELIHNDPDTQAFYKAWFYRVQLDDRADRFVSDLYKSGNVVARRYTGKVTKPRYKKWVDGQTFADEIGYNQIPEKQRVDIPLKYVFYRPSYVYLVGDEAGALSEDKRYGLRIPTEKLLSLQNAKTPIEKKVYDALPPDIKEAVKNNQSNYIIKELPKDSIYVSHYKKDDADIWAFPLTYAILPILMYNQSLVATKTKALEGWYNSVRIWKLGDHKEQILPTPGAADKLHDILSNNTGGGGIDLIWDSMLDYEEHYPPVEKLVNFIEDKSSVLICFGIPEEIAGGIMSGSGSSNNSALRLKNFIKKLEAGRKELIRWLKFELEIVHRNMGFEGPPPHIRFEYDDLMDEKVYFTLLRELSDRGILSNQTMIERVKEIPEVETHRIQQEEKMIDSGKLPPRAGPFNNPQLETQHDMEMEKTQLTLDYKPQPDKKPGRPNGATDKLPRKRGGKGKAALTIYATDVFDKINNAVTERILSHFEVRDVRSLTGDQKEMLDEVRTNVFAQIEPDTVINDDILDRTLSFDNVDIIKEFNQIYQNLLLDISSEGLTNKQRELLKIQAYIDLWV